MVWEPIINEFRDSVETDGYFHWNQSFQEFKRARVGRREGFDVRQDIKDEWIRYFQ